MSTISLLVRGYRYEFWEKLTVSKGIEALADSFSVEVSDKWANISAVAPMRSGDAIQIQIDDELVLTGFIDKLSPAFSATSHTIKITGRSMAADLVDCSIANQDDPTKGVDELNNVLVSRAIQLIALPFGIGVFDKVGDTTKIKKFKTQPGERGYEAISRLAAEIGVIVVSRPDGGIEIQRTGSIKSSTILLQDPGNQNSNIKSGSSDFDDSQRFSDYTVKSQTGAVANTTEANLSTKVQGTAKDEGVGRFRPLILIAENSSDTDQARKRAEWEAASRAGEALTASVQVVGWRNGDGLLWVPNTLIRVESVFLYLDAEMLITEVLFSKTVEGGTTTTLTLKRPDAFTPEPVKPEKSESQSKFLPIVG